MAVCSRLHLRTLGRFFLLITLVFILDTLFLHRHETIPSWQKLKHIHLQVYQSNVSTPMEAAKDRSQVLFPEKPLVIWSNDYHISPIQDLKQLLSPLGVNFIDKSLSHHCRQTKTCAKDLKVINRGNGLNLNPALIPKFYEAYKDDPVMKTVDAFVCFHPSAMCELFIPFEKSIIVIASTRYEMGRLKPKRWRQWNANLIQIAQDQKNIVAANNIYDAEYIKYFTGLTPLLLPSFCGYIKKSYNASRPGFLLAPIHKRGFEDIFLKQFEASVAKFKSSVLLTPLRKLYKHYEYSDLTAHSGIVYVPYQVSVMSLFEQYRMNIPLFFPTVDLLADWQLNNHVMKERTWAMVKGRVPGKSSISGVNASIPDPNNEKDFNAIKYWIKYSDFYQVPHITYYNGTDDLVQKLQNTDLQKISMRMKQYNAKFMSVLLEMWRVILQKVALHSSNHPK